MFLLALLGSLVLGAGLLAAASYSEGTLLALKTAAQVIGWLLLLASAVGIRGLRPATLGALTAAMVTFVSGVAVLYLSYVAWAEKPQAAIPLAAIPPQAAMPQAAMPQAAIPQAAVIPPAAASEILSVRQVDYTPIDDPILAKTLAFAPAREAALAVSLKEPAAREIEPTPKVVADPCRGFVGVESLQCKRCARTEGLQWILCQESVRLEYCEGRRDDASACPSALSYSPPG